MNKAAGADIKSGKTVLGIELGSTRIKAVLIDLKHGVLATGGHNWENRFEGGYWTYSLDEVWDGIRACYRELKQSVKERYGETLITFGAIGVSGMMHGYLAFDSADRLLTPFRTWRNGTAEKAAEKLTEVFNFKIPARWSIAHLYQAASDGEAHVKDVAGINTLAGYVHYMLTGKRVLGTGEASGMFPIGADGNYDRAMLGKFDALPEISKYGLRAVTLLPAILPAGERAGELSAEGALLLDPEGDLVSGIPLCPPEGDAGTGMVATNSVRVGTGNVSAGTSVFSMLVLEKGFDRVHPEIDMVTTPAGDPVAMVHCNNFTSEINAWVSLFGEFAELIGAETDKNELYEKLFKKALTGDADCGGVITYNYLSGEHITGVEAGRPLTLRTTESRFNLANFMRSQLYSSLATLKIGLDILLKEEHARIDSVQGHGGIFKTEGVMQRFFAAAFNALVTVSATANEGGPWGMALLAAYMLRRNKGEELSAYLARPEFAVSGDKTVSPDPADIAGLDRFMQRFTAALPVVREAVRVIKD